MTFHNFINIMTSNKCNIDDNIDAYDISLYNSMINENEFGEENFENIMEELLKNNKDIVYSQGSSIKRVSR